MAVYKFTAFVEVTDDKRLFLAAFKRAREDGLSDVEALAALRAEEGGPNEANCIHMLLDPGSLEGCEIQEFSAEWVEGG